ncbi:MAG: sugar ABC transporter permease [Pseudomonadota bacterium]|nr:sugar ABC transporter permease [Pseudomonadota bacterium]
MTALEHDHAPPLQSPARAAPGRRGGRWTPYVWLAPMLVLLGLFTYWPFIHTVLLSVLEWNLNPGVATRFVGGANYEGLVHNPLFLDALRNTAIYIAGSIPLKVLLPIPVAVFLWSLGSAGHVYRSIIFLPTLISFVVISVIFLWMLNPIFGHAKQAFAMIGIDLPYLLADPDSALWTILAISTWKIIGFNTLLYIAGLSSISRDHIEAMRLDGAGDLALLRHLIWPLLTPTTFFVLVATVIFSIQQVFTPIDIMTEGGPANGTTNLFYMVYQYTFVVFNVGYGAAGTVLLFALIFAVTLVKVRLLDRHVHYER